RGRLGADGRGDAGGGAGGAGATSRGLTPSHAGADCGAGGKAGMLAVMSFLGEYAASDVAARTGLTLRWLASRPRALFAELQREQPIFSTPKFVLVTRHAEVLEVLTRDDVFLGPGLEARRQPRSLAARSRPRAA